MCGQDVESWVSFDIETSEFSRCIGAVGSNPARLWCPVCRSTDRERHLLMFFGALRILERLTGGAVLHIAPEPILVTAIRCARPRHYVKGDLTPNHSSVEPIDVERIPYPDQTFDLAVCNHTLEHVTDPGRALSELRRILKPGGRLICQTPYAERLSKTFEEPLLQSPEQRTFLYGQDDHLRAFGRDIVAIIAAAGFAGRLIPHEEIIQGVDPEMLGINEFEPFFDFVAV
ncbi:Methyltransferase domain-containing protein [Rhizobiales bacterium GAS191]|nr:Methyltransferase domain-containing protein [Rhizobiales bacterium GAS191]